MSTTLRLLDSAQDYPSLAKLLNQIETEAVTVEVLQQRDRVIAQELRWRHVVVDQAKEVIGSSLILGRQVESTDRFYLWVAVDPIWRNQGIGTTLFNQALGFVLARGARVLTSSVSEEHPQGLRFAQKRGFTIDRHIFISRLDLPTFEACHFAGLIESVKDSGIRFFSLADADDTPKIRRQLYEVHRITAQDVPNFDGDFASYEGYCEAVFEAPGFRPEGQFLAVVKDQVVGIALLKYERQSNAIFNLMTGVLPDYRGRKIAQALKLQSILYARTIGADYLYTGNDSENAPMLAINRKLGYRPQLGVFQLVKKMEDMERRAAEHACDADAPATFYFLGVTTGQSSMMQIFPRWMADLGRDVRLVGVDLPIQAAPERYRALVETIKGDPLARGGLITTHKIDLLAASRDLFDTLDPYAELCGEVSCISKHDGALIGRAVDPITAGLCLQELLGQGYWTRSGGQALCMGAGGAGIAISVYLLSHPNDRPAKLIVTDRDQARLDGLRAIHAQLGGDIPVEYVHTHSQRDHDVLLAQLPEGSLVVNATGMGKDTPGSPISDAAEFPGKGVIWELNYRGERQFLSQAQAQAQSRGLTIVDGWRYFVLSWTTIMEEVLHVKLSDAQVQRWDAIAASTRG